MFSWTFFGFICVGVLVLQIKHALWRKHKATILQITTNTSPNRFAEFSHILPFGILLIIRDYDNAGQDVELDLVFPFFEKSALLARPNGNYIIRLFNTFIEVFDWTQNLSTIHLQDRYYFKHLDILNECEILFQTDDGELVLYNFKTKKRLFIFENEYRKNFTFHILPNRRILILTKRMNILVDLNNIKKKQTFSACCLPWTKNHVIRIQYCNFRQCFETNYGYIFQVYDLRIKSHFLLQWDTERNLWKQCGFGTCLFQLEKHMFKLHHWDSFGIQLRVCWTKRWNRKRCGYEFVEIDPNDQVNKAAQLWIAFKYSDNWCYDNGFIYNFDGDFQKCRLYA